MNLSFSTHWADKSLNYFVGKIWSGILRTDSLARKELNEKLYEQYYHTAYGFFISRKTKEHPNDLFGEFGFQIDYATDLHPKIHTLREDKKDRWKEGNRIHPIIYNRTPNRFQFMPVLPVLSTQKVVISQFEDTITKFKYRTVKIGDTWKYSNTIFSQESESKILEFVKNDGFDDIDSFFDYFFPKKEKLLVKELKLIHWTPLKYELL